MRYLVLLALLVAGCGPALPVDNAIARMEDTVLGSMRAFEAERPKSCNSTNLVEAEGTANYAVNVMSPRHTAYRGPRQQAIGCFRSPTPREGQGARTLRAASTTESCKST
jgi:hypothetical protein